MEECTRECTGRRSESKESTKSKNRNKKVIKVEKKN
jgi:hypothetical protein